MLIVKNNKIELSNEFVNCNNEIKPIGEEGKQWWIDTCEVHNYSLEFLPSDYSKEVLDRFEEIKDFDIEYINYLELYVQDGTISNKIQLIIENVKLKQTIADLTETVLMGGI